MPLDQSLIAEIPYSQLPPICGTCKHREDDYDCSSRCGRPEANGEGVLFNFTCKHHELKVYNDAV